MIKKYNVSCDCGFKKDITFGKEGDKKITEVFSCQKCKNLFSVDISESKKCPDCGNEQLVQYIPDKKRNLNYYKKMLESGVLKEDKHTEIVDFWNKIEDHKCPNCKKDTLKWNE